MHRVIQDKLPQVADLCRRFYVSRLEVFGSAANGEFDEARSDLDFLVEFGDVHRGKRFDTFFELMFALQDLFGRKVDLVEASAMRNPYFIRQVNDGRRLVYRT